ncbi:MAG: ABC transporter ATP-binding protein [Bacteroidales bacterium]|nr:ABC transporter ATP-binding protein [Bacteroidales bacterium]
MAVEIQIKNLKKKYPNGTEALKGIHLQIEKGQVFALLGPNGAGKSTLVRILTTLIQKDTGDFSIGSITPPNNPSQIQKYIGVALQENELDPNETVTFLLQFQGQLFGMTRKQAQTRADELINLFQLGSERNKKAGMLSGGNKRRLHCALALVHKPQVLFLDEPTVGMDPLARHTFWNVISDLNTKEKVTILLTTQYLEEADKYATQMAMIIDGMIQYAGEVSEFKHLVHPNENASLEDSYLSYLKTLTNTEKE